MQEPPISGQTPGQDPASPVVSYLDPVDDRRAEAIGTIERVAPQLRVVPVSGVDAVADIAPADHRWLVVAHDPPTMDATQVLDAVDTDEVSVLLRTDDTAVLDSLAGSVADYYRLGADDSLVAERLADATRTVAQTEGMSALDRMTDALFALDPEWRLTYLNERAASVLAAAMDRDGATPSELEGVDLWDAIPEAVDTPFYDHYHAAMERQEPVSFEARYDPLDAWYKVRVYPSESGISVYFQDVTDDRRRRSVLERRESILRRIYRTIANPKASFDEQVADLVRIGSDALNLEYGTLSHVDGGKYIFEVVESPAGTIEAGDTVPLSETNCERAVVTEQTIVLEDIAAQAPELTDRAGYTDAGIECYIGAPVYVDDEVYGTFCFYDTETRAEPFSEWEVTLVDLLSQWVSTELERQQTNKELTEKNKRLERFAGIVSHDLRNPLNVATSRLELARQEVDSEHLDDVAGAHDRMASLIDDLLVLAREGSDVASTEPVSLSTVASAAWTAVDTDGHTLEIDTDRVVLADRNQLQRLLENLFRNAVEHGSTSPDSQAHQDAAEHGSTSPGSHARQDAVEHGSQPDGDGVTVTVGSTEEGFYVADDGPGISPEDREAIFETGYSTNEFGTGLGLSIAEQLTAAHGWTVSATDSVDGGARFEFDNVDFVE